VEPYLRRKIEAPDDKNVTAGGLSKNLTWSGPGHISRLHYGRSTNEHRNMTRPLKSNIICNIYRLIYVNSHNFSVKHSGMYIPVGF